MDAHEAQEAVRGLHAAVDHAVKPVENRHRERLQCRRGCSDCCRDELTVFEVEAERIRAEFSDVLAEAPGPAGGCAFLDGEGACRIYAARPYVCRTQGLPLRWLDEREDGLVELRDICPLNEGPEQPPLETLAAEDCWTLGPYEGRLAHIQQAYAGALRRVPLRDLFA